MEIKSKMSLSTPVDYKHDVSSLTNFAIGFVRKVLLFNIYGGPTHFWNIAARCNLVRFTDC